MDDVTRLQPATRGDGGATDGDAADFIAFALDGFAALAANGSGYAATQLQIVVRGVDDGVSVHFGQVALLDDDFLSDVHGHEIIAEASHRGNDRQSRAFDGGPPFEGRQARSGRL